MEVATLSLIGSAISGVTGFIGSMQQGAAAARAAEYSAAVARNNQIIADQNARYAAAAGEAKAQAQDFKNRSIFGAIEAAQGASGISLDSPTLREVRDSAQQIGRLDTATIMQDALLTSRSYSAQAANFGAEAELDTMRASNARTSGFTSGFGSLLGSASSFADKWSRFKTVGAL